MRPCSYCERYVRSMQLRSYVLLRGTYICSIYLAIYVHTLTLCDRYVWSTVYSHVHIVESYLRSIQPCIVESYARSICSHVLLTGMQGLCSHVVLRAMLGLFSHVLLSTTVCYSRSMQPCIVESYARSMQPLSNIHVLLRGMLDL